VVFDIFGSIKNPLPKYGGVETGLVSLLNNVLHLIFIVAGLFALFQFIFAGFDFINAGGNPETMNKAWNKIWQALVGLMIVVVSFLIAMLIGQILFGDPQAILNPKIYGPGV